MLVHFYAEDIDMEVDIPEAAVPRVGDHLELDSYVPTDIEYDEDIHRSDYLVTHVSWTYQTPPGDKMDDGSRRGYLKEGAVKIIRLPRGPM